MITDSDRPVGALMDNDAERLRAYLQGWDDAIECQRQTLAWVPDEQLVVVIRMQNDRPVRSGT